MFKVAVIGLGPAGSAALRRLNELDVKAIGIERKKEVETPTVCGEFLPEPEAIPFISEKPSVRLAFKYISLVKRLNTFNEVRLEIEGVKTFRMKIPGFTISRKELAERLVEGSNHILGDDVVYVRREAGYYVIKTRKGRTFESEYIISAEGYPSLTRRFVGCPARLDDADVALGVNMKMLTPGMEEKIVYMYASPKTPGGYAWIIPHRGDVSNVGIGVRYNFIRKGVDPIRLLHDFIRLNPHNYFDSSKILEPPRSRWIPVSGFYASPTCGNVLFAGDSLGATNPINGGGIFTSMALGILAAESVWLDNPSIYQERAWREVGSILLIGRRYRRLVDFMYSNWRYTGLLALVPEKFMARVIKGEKTFLYYFLTPGRGS